MKKLAVRNWVPSHVEQHIQTITDAMPQDGASIEARLETLLEDNYKIHTQDCFNLNPATNVMNPRAEAVLASGVGSRPSLGYPGNKYETGLEAIEQIEVYAAELAARVFDAKFAEIRVASGSAANLYSFMALTKPGDTIIVPPADIGGHVTHNTQGCAGLFGLNIIEAPVNSDGYTIDTEQLLRIAKKERPKLITVGGSLNLFEHPIAELRKIADRVKAKLLVDAAHQCGLFAGGAWKNPLSEGAHLMTMSTYKSLGGPPSGLIFTNEPDIAERIDAIAFPGMTANFDVAKSAALVITLLDWITHGAAYAKEMIDMSIELARELDQNGVPVFATGRGYTASHQFAVDATRFFGGQRASQHLRKAGFLTCGIGLPISPLESDMNGIRFGTPELVRWGMTKHDAPRLGAMIADALRRERPETMASETARWRASFDRLHFMRPRGV